MESLLTVIQRISVNKISTFYLFYFDDSQRTKSTSSNHKYYNPRNVDCHVNRSHIPFETSI